MKTVKKTYSMRATTAGAICASQTPAGAGNLTINGTLASGGTVTLASGNYIPQRIRITSAGNDSGRTFTLTGKDRFGNTQSESITGANAGSANCTKNYSVITSISVDAATAGALTVDTLGTAETGWVQTSTLTNPFNVGYQVDIGTATFTIEGTMADLSSTSNHESAPSFTVEASGSSDVSGVITKPTSGLRTKITAFTSGDIVFYMLQAG